MGLSSNLVDSPPIDADCPTSVPYCPPTAQFALNLPLLIVFALRSKLSHPYQPKLTLALPDACSGTPWKCATSSFRSWCPTSVRCLLGRRYAVTHDSTSTVLIACRPFFSLVSAPPQALQAVAYELDRVLEVGGGSARGAILLCRDVDDSIAAGLGNLQGYKFQSVSALVPALAAAKRRQQEQRAGLIGEGAHEGQARAEAQRQQLVEWLTHDSCTLFGHTNEQVFASGTELDRVIAEGGTGELVDSLQSLHCRPSITRFEHLEN